MTRWSLANPARSGGAPEGHGREPVSIAPDASFRWHDEQEFAVEQRQGECMMRFGLLGGAPTEMGEQASDSQIYTD
jgi:hypothetical protein